MLHLHNLTGKSGASSREVEMNLFFSARDDVLVIQERMAAEVAASLNSNVVLPYSLVRRSREEIWSKITSCEASTLLLLSNIQMACQLTRLETFPHPYQLRECIDQNSMMN